MTEPEGLTTIEDPGVYRLDWEQVAREVRSNSGQWCRVSRAFNPTVAMHIRRGKYPHVPPEEFEVTTRACAGQPNKSWIFLRTK